MRNSFLLLFVTLVWVGCGSAIDKKVDASTMQEDIQELRVIYKDTYTDADFESAKNEIVTLIFGRVLRKEKNSTEASKFKLDKTYKEFLEEAKIKRITYDERRAAYESEIAILNQKLSIKIIDKNLKNKDKYGLKKHLELSFEIKNIYSKDIKGFESDVLIDDMFDNEITNLNLAYTEILKAGQTDTFTYYWDATYDSRLEQVGAEAIGKLKFKIYPITILYTDGEKEKAPPVPEK